MPGFQPHQLMYGTGFCMPRRSHQTTEALKTSDRMTAPCADRENGDLKARDVDVILLTPAARRFILMPLCLFFESTESPVVRRSPFLWNSDDVPFKHLDYDIHLRTECRSGRCLAIDSPAQPFRIISAGDNFEMFRVRRQCLE
jgi:hypothetical protein